MTARHGALFEVEFNDPRPVLDILNAIGHMPLPPYIDRRTRTPTANCIRRFTVKTGRRRRADRRAAL